jgi:hypothetical protein
MVQTSLEPWQEDILTELYCESAMTVDELPYTDEFERLYTQFVGRTNLTWNRNRVWRALSNCRKASKLVRKTR